MGENPVLCSALKKPCWILDKWQHININFLIYEMKGLGRRVLKFPIYFLLSLSIPDPLITVLDSRSQLLTSPL